MGQFFVFDTCAFHFFLGDTLNGALSDNSINGEQGIQSMEPSRQALIDRIIKLQEINAKRAEKLDFFEEHTRTLVEELQKKTRIIQNYILHENIGAMGNNDRDRYKVSFNLKVNNPVELLDFQILCEFYHLHPSILKAGEMQ